MAPEIDEHVLEILLVLKATPMGEARHHVWIQKFPRSFQAAMQHGYLVRVGTDKAAITPTGRAFVAGVLYQQQRRV